jgi:hypothetical protein
MEDNMNGKWLKLGVIVAVVAVVSLFAASTVANAQGPRDSWGGPQESLVAVAAEVLDMEQTALVSALNGGKTIADVAKEKGVALDKIVDAFLAGRMEFLKNAVSAKRLTQAQADAILAQMRTQITAQLSAPFIPRGYSMGIGFTDENQDGVCDFCGVGVGAGHGMMDGRGGRWGR